MSKPTPYEDREWSEQKRLIETIQKEVDISAKNEPREPVDSVWAQGKWGRMGKMEAYSEMLADINKRLDFLREHLPIDHILLVELEEIVEYIEEKMK